MKSEVRELQEAVDHESLMPLAERLSEPPTKSTRHMSHEERVDGVLQMLLDLERQAKGDGCIAAAWAFEKLSALTAHPADERPVTGEWLEEIGGRHMEDGEYLFYGPEDSMFDNQIQIAFDPPKAWLMVVAPNCNENSAAIKCTTRTSVLSLLSALGVEMPRQ